MIIMIIKNLKRQAFWLALFLLVGCAGLARNYGTIVPDESVSKSFENYQMDPNMNYYYSGSDLWPSAIIGLKKQYELANTLWQPIKPEPRIFRQFVSSMRDKASAIGQFQHGQVMKAPDGRVVGVWYSLLGIKMGLRMGEGNKVDVYPPDQNVYGDADDSPKRK